MEASDNEVSSSPAQNGTSLTQITDIISDKQRQIFTVITDIFLCGLGSVFGILANIVNLIIFYKQGLNTTINISFFAMGVSDLCTMIFQLWYIICVIPNFEGLRIPMVYSDVQYLLGGIPREVFARITYVITVYITAERCLCIVFPLQVKQIITAERTTAIIICIYLMTWSYVVPLYSIFYLDWKISPDKNETLLGLFVTSNRDAVEGKIYITHAVSGIVSLVAIVLFTTILIQKLEEKSVWRKTANIHQKKAQSISKRDKTTMLMVVLIASILIICYIPAVMLGVTTFCVPEFSAIGKYSNFYYIMWSFAFLFETINSSVNIFLYLKMSTKFRLIFKDLFLRCGGVSKNYSR